MDLTLSAEDRAFRAEVQAFLTAELPADLAKAGSRCTGIYNDYPEANAWHRILARRGWSVPHWPVEHGGCDWSPIQHYIFDYECASAGAPAITPNATHMVAPVLMAFGTPEQKAQFLPRIASGDDWWAQGYSEPGSGSDLASLRCAAVADGDEYVINGSKIWTTHAHFSNQIFCLVRTAKTDKPQIGISFLVFSLDRPGIEVRPIISISGDHELNEVFFTDARVSRSSLVGEENDGWTVAKYLLQHERSHCWSPLLHARLGRMRQRLADTAGDRHPADQQMLALRMAEIGARLSAFEMCELRMIGGQAEGSPLASGSTSMNKIVGTELRQDMSFLALDIEGSGALPTRSARASHDDAVEAGGIYLNDRAASIYAGTNEIQRTIVATSFLRQWQPG
ncbi:acyl-CoA dehydrogenase family protein [Sphingopyxis sp.]|uniref:acyl-CoA dehydrogenase family protein n=1 Tax=Sphingopyxis sp. TaxID=1908224 RepID=UPI003BA98350